MADEIPGTRVPDTPIHRASLWLEQLKFAERAGVADEAEPMDALVYELLLRELDNGVTPEQLEEAAIYYGANLRQMFVPGRAEVIVQTPHGALDLRTMFVSAWLDGWMHGAVTQKGLRGESTEERDGR